MDRIKTDVLVVGAGPAGATAANLLAQANVKVLLVDRCNFPRDKVCGDAITPSALPVLRELGVLPQIEKQFSPVFGVKFLFQGDPNQGHASSSQSPFYGFVAPRLLFDQLLLNSAIDKGVTFLPDTTISKPQIENNQVIGARGKQSRTELNIEAKITISADGSGGGFVRKLGLHDNRKPPFLAARAYYYGARTNPGVLEFYFWKEFLPFYAWIFPIGNELANIGIVFPAERHKKFPIREAFSHFIQTLSKTSDKFASATQLNDLEIFPLCMNFFPMHSFTSGALAIGDAAGLVHPVLGEGIGFALDSGRLATKHVFQSLQTGDYSKSSLRGYGNDLSRKYLPSFRFAKFLRGFMLTPGISRILLNLLRYT